MTRLNAIQPESATGKAKELLDAVQAKLKITPNMTRVMANSPAVLQSYLSFSGALSGGSTGAKLGELIALTVAEQNGCEYCLSAHTTIGKMVGLQADQLEAARDGLNNDPKVHAALTFAKQIVVKHGRTSDEDFAAVRNAGYSDAEIAEIVAHVVLNIFTNYFNLTAGTEVDFPKVGLRRTA